MNKEDKKFMEDYIKARESLLSEGILDDSETRICEVFNSILTNKYDVHNELLALINIIENNKKYITEEFRLRLIMEINYSIKLIKGRNAK